MPSNKLEKELLRKLAADSPKARKNIFIKEYNWQRLVEWGEKQNPPIKPSALIDALIEMFFDEQERD